MKPLFITIILLFCICYCPSLYAETGTASYYTAASCQEEGTSGIYTATGEPYDENLFTCARPRRSDFGKVFKVTNLKNGKSVITRCNDLGPAKRLAAKGRVIDLSRGAFQAIGNLRDGLIPVKVEEVSND